MTFPFSLVQHAINRKDGLAKTVHDAVGLVPWVPVTYALEDDVR